VYPFVQKFSVSLRVIGVVVNHAFSGSADEYEPGMPKNTQDNLAIDVRFPQPTSFLPRSHSPSTRLFVVADASPLLFVTVTPNLREDEEGICCRFDGTRSRGAVGSSSCACGLLPRSCMGRADVFRWLGVLRIL